VDRHGDFLPRRQQLDARGGMFVTAVIRWVDRELRAMCAQGFWGVVAAGIIVTAALLAPIEILEYLALGHL
jgi:hypothetical protein